MVKNRRFNEGLDMKEEGWWGLDDLWWDSLPALWWPLLVAKANGKCIHSIGEVWGQGNYS